VTSLCQLAGDWRGNLPPGGVLSEPKIDGWRCLAFRGIDGKFRLWTRQGMPIEGADHVLYKLGLMDRAAGGPMFWDGEIQVGGSLAATKQWFEGGWKRGGERGTFHAFDCMTQAEWRAGGSSMPLYQRKAQLAAIMRAVDEDEALSWEYRPGSKGDDAWRSSVTILPDLWLETPADVIAEARRVWAGGGEGLVLKDAEAPYRRNRNAGWLKVKAENMHKWRKAA